MPLQMPSPGVEVLESVLNEGVSCDRELTLLENEVATPEAKPPDNSQSPRNGEERSLITELNDSIASGVYELDAMLQKITEASRKLTGASGAAIAMWKDGSVVCRASCGDGAPPLGAQLSVESGISGHCLRSGLAQHCGETEADPRVDAELCRQLGLRSVAVLPVRGWRGVNGILEVFSTEPRAFREQHFEILEALAGLAERARASHASPESGKVITPAEESKDPRPLLPASDRFRDFAALLFGAKKRTMVLATAVVIGLLLIGVVIWLGWRNPDSVKAKVNNSTPLPARAQTVSLRDQDAVWQPNPGGEKVFSSPAGSGSGRAPAKTETTPKQKGQEHAQKSSSVVDSGTAEIVKHYPTSEQPASLQDSVAEAPPVVSAALNPAALDNLLSVSKPEPKLSAARVSRGLSNGYLVRHIPPVYPQQARMTRIEGDVVLSALIAEDGTVHDLKVVTGQPTLARAAVDAVRQWRYKPYELNGKPVNMNTTITVSFKLP